MNNATPTTENAMTTPYKYAAPKTDLTEATARVHYAHVLECAKWFSIDAAALQAGAQAKNPNANKTGVEWVQAAKRVTNGCRKCRGTGVYGWGVFTNGKPEFSGPCFKCGGKGYMTHEDRKRNIDHAHFGECSLHG